MDNDTTGLEMNAKISSTFDIPNIHNPLDKPKDASDWIKTNKEEYEKWVNEEIIKITAE
jgi:ubiquitin-protein ligase